MPFVQIDNSSFKIMFINKSKIVEAGCYAGEYFQLLVTAKATASKTRSPILKLSRKCFFEIVALASLLFTPLAQASELEWNQIRAEIELKPNEKEAKAEFLVTNVGEQTIHIDRIKTSCGCTGSILDQKSLKPGESTTIVGTFKKGNRQGLNHNQLQVFLKGQSEPVETLHMLVQVPQLIQINPYIVYWNRSSSKTERQVQIKLDKRYLSKISAIEYDSELLNISKAEDREGNFDQILTILPKSFDKQLRHTVMIKAEGEDDLSTQAKLMIFVQPR